MSHANASRTRFFPVLRCLTVLALAFAASCSTSQRYGTVTVAPNTSNPLRAGDLEAHGVAFITPATVTGQEEDRPALALIFSEVLAELRPGARIIPLNETLSAISRAGASEDFNRLVMENRDSGLLNRAALAQVSKVTGARYIAQLKMASFQQESQGRLGVVGLRLVETKKANIRLFLRIWDGANGSVAWEGAQELYMAKETVTEKTISFHDIVDTSARALIARIP